MSDTPSPLDAVLAALEPPLNPAAPAIALHRRWHYTEAQGWKLTVQDLLAQLPDGRFPGRVPEVWTGRLINWGRDNRASAHIAERAPDSPLSDPASLRRIRGAVKEFWARLLYAV